MGPKQHTSMVFIGIDLAWSPRNLSGVAVIDGDTTGGKFIDNKLIKDDSQIIEYIKDQAAERPALVLIDAPLRVPNDSGRRPAEAELGKAFRAYEAAAHPANRKLLAINKKVPPGQEQVRGEMLVAALAKRGFVHYPTVQAGVATRQVIEVFPHPAMVAIFRLQRTLKYKARSKRKRSLAYRLAEWQCYQQQLCNLAQANPALTGHESFVTADVSAMRECDRKEYEDQVDALFCAYIGLYAYRWGMARCRVFGTLDEGYIFTPVPEEMQNSSWPS